MNIAGIIVEYNPLHNGHIYHIEQTKKITNCDYLIAIMSGNFVQRGEPAIINKWARTEIALKAGIDLVIELPLIYSISSAENFAFGAISILNELKIVDSICFGSELGNIEQLFEIAKILADEPINFKKSLKNNLKKGFSYAKAREIALKEYFDKSNHNIENIINKSNNILGIEYLKSLIKSNSKIKPFTIQRIKSSYNDTKITSNIASATSIRLNFDNLDLIKNAIPQFTFETLLREKNNGKCPINLNLFTDILLYKLRSMSESEIKKIHDVSEGLENKLKIAAEEVSNLEDLIKMTISKRYTKTRIQRILLYILLNITKDLYFQQVQKPRYIRILGANTNGRKIIKKLKESTNLPIIINPSKKDKELLDLDIKATDIYSLAYKNDQYKIAKQDLKIPPVLL